jgi:hypothetical protein
MYKENPKTKGSGIITCIPQTGTCPNKCEDCFFQSGRSYLEPLEKNLPNMPVDFENRVVRVNDGNDSNVNPEKVIADTQKYPMRFYNTSIPENLEKFSPFPVVLTINPGKMTDRAFHKLNPIPENLMFVRFRANVWNRALGLEAVKYYTKIPIPIIFTFVAYYTEKVPKDYKDYYTYKKRTLNSYWAIKSEAWNMIMSRYKDNAYVYTCGKNANTFACHRCGNCLREYFATMEYMKERKNHE